MWIIPFTSVQMICSGMVRFVRVVAHAASSTINLFTMVLQKPNQSYHRGYYFSSSVLIVVDIYNHNVCTLFSPHACQIMLTSLFCLSVTCCTVQHNKLQVTRAQYNTAHFFLWNIIWQIHGTIQCLEECLEECNMLHGMKFETTYNKAV